MGLSTSNAGLSCSSVVRGLDFFFSDMEGSSSSLIYMNVLVGGGCVKVLAKEWANCKVW